MNPTYIRGTLLRSVDDQRAGGDPQPIDPATLGFDPEREYPLLLDFNQSQVLGKVKLFRAEDGSIGVEGVIVVPPEIHGLDEGPGKLAIGANVRKERKEDDVLRDAEILEVSLGNFNQDKGLPDVEIVPGPQS